jgi:hypothetical protein
MCNILKPLVQQIGGSCHAGNWEWPGSPNLILGGGVSNFYTATSGGASTVDGNSFGALVYGIYTAGQATISASAMAGHLGTNISRGLPTLGETGKTASNGAYEAAALWLQYNLLSGPRFFVTPYVSVSYLHTGLGSAQETGAGILDLRYDAMSTSLAELGAGVNGGLSTPVKYGTLTAWAGLGGEGTLGNPHVHVRDTEVLGSFSAGGRHPRLGWTVRQRRKRREFQSGRKICLVGQEYS